MKRIPKILLLLFTVVFITSFSVYAGSLDELDVDERKSSVWDYYTEYDFTRVLNLDKQDQEEIPLKYKAPDGSRDRLVEVVNIKGTTRYLPDQKDNLDNAVREMEKVSKLVIGDGSRDTGWVNGAHLRYWDMHKSTDVLIRPANISIIAARDIIDPKSGKSKITITSQELILSTNSSGDRIKILNINAFDEINQGIVRWTDPWKGGYYYTDLIESLKDSKYKIYKDNDIEYYNDGILYSYKTEYYKDEVGSAESVVLDYVEEKINFIPVISGTIYVDNDKRKTLKTYKRLATDFKTVAKISRLKDGTNEKLLVKEKYLDLGETKFDLTAIDLSGNATNIIKGASEIVIREAKKAYEKTFIVRTKDANNLFKTELVHMQLKGGKIKTDVLLSHSEKIEGILLDAIKKGELEFKGVKVSDILYANLTRFTYADGTFLRAEIDVRRALIDYKGNVLMTTTLSKLTNNQIDYGLDINVKNLGYSEVPYQSITTFVVRTPDEHFKIEATQPEPSTIVLMLLGLVSAACVGIKKRFFG